MGPLVTAPAPRQGDPHYLDAGHRGGRQLVIDGRECDIDSDGEGFFLAALFDNVTPAMSIYKDEIFGPVLSVCGSRPTTRPSS